MKRRYFFPFLALVVAFVLWRHQRESEGPAPSPAASNTIVATKAADAAAPSSADHSPLAAELNAPDGNIRRDLRIVADLIETHRTNFPREGNPVGDNAEITAALTGKNKLGLALLPPNHPAINRAGELCDRWGVPFFFHAESATNMEIRSAGPDRKMWTDDDVVLNP